VSASTVLLIDDDPEILEALRLVLERKCYRVVTAGDGQEGIDMARQENPDLIVVDMLMPQKSGFLVLEEVKDAGASRPKVIMITANEGEHHQAYAELLGADDYLRKPFTADAFLESVERLCAAPPLPQ
jgi:DNA-binding response OmpR family regulator